jgi:hypothetical protein
MAGRNLVPCVRLYMPDVAAVTVFSAFSVKLQTRAQSFQLAQVPDATGLAVSNYIIRLHIRSWCRHSGGRSARTMNRNPLWRARRKSLTHLRRHKKEQAEHAGELLWEFRRSDETQGRVPSLRPEPDIDPTKAGFKSGFPPIFAKILL